MTRLRSQLLAGEPAASATAAESRILAVQAQDLRGARLAIRARTRGLTSADVESALTADRSLIVTWLNRGTLHLVTPTDYWWLHPLTTPQLVSGNVRRLRQEGVDEAQATRGVAVVREAVAEGPKTRHELRDRLTAAGVPTKGQALIHVLFAASLAGHTVRGPMVGNEHAYVAVGDWLGPAPAPIERMDALARLARRYLAGHGPADAADLAKWAGINLGDARLALATIRDEVVDGPGGLSLATDSPVPHEFPPPRLLGAFEPCLLGWATRDLIGGDRPGVIDGGVFRPIALAGGRVVATWGIKNGSVRITPLEPLPPAVTEAMSADAADVAAFLGMPDRVRRRGSMGR
jgi:hypothetical protein